MILSALAVTYVLTTAALLHLTAYFSLSSMQVLKLREAEEDADSVLSGFIERKSYFLLSFGAASAALVAMFVYLFQLSGIFAPLTPGARFAVSLAVLSLTYFFSALVSAAFAENIFLRTLPLMKMLGFCAAPLAYPFYLLSMRLRPERENDEEDREEEIEAFLDEGRREGILEVEESELIRGIMEFSDTIVREVMTPRMDIVSIVASASLDDALKVFAKSRHTRLPVYEEHIDNIIGAIWVKDILKPAISGHGASSVKEFVRAVPYVPENKPIADLLKDFQSQKEQLAIIVDEYGGVDGLVTTEDLLEEIVGEIEERGETEGSLIKKLEDGSVEAKGRASLGDISEMLDDEIPEGDYDSVAGWIATKLGSIPQGGEKFDIDGFRAEILSADKRRILRVRISKIKVLE